MGLPRYAHMLMDPPLPTYILSTETEVFKSIHCLCGVVFLSSSRYEKCHTCRAMQEVPMFYLISLHITLCFLGRYVSNCHDKPVSQLFNHLN